MIYKIKKNIVLLYNIDKLDRTIRSIVYVVVKNKKINKCTICENIIH